MEAGPEGVLVRMHVLPGARQERVPAGYDPWRRALTASLTAPPQEGKANQAVCRALADLLGCPPDSVQVRRGARNRKKTLEIRGVTCEYVLRRLAEVMP